MGSYLLDLCLLLVVAGAREGVRNGGEHVRRLECGGMSARVGVQQRARAWKPSSLRSADMGGWEVRGEREVCEVDGAEVGRHPEVHDDVLCVQRVGFKRCGWGSEIGRLTIGSCEITRVDIPTEGSAPIPATFSVHAT